MGQLDRELVKTAVVIKIMLIHIKGLLHVKQYSKHFVYI